MRGVAALVRVAGFQAIASELTRNAETSRHTPLGRVDTRPMPRPKAKRTATKEIVAAEAVLAHDLDDDSPRGSTPKGSLEAAGTLGAQIESQTAVVHEAEAAMQWAMDLLSAEQQLQQPSPPPPPLPPPPPPAAAASRSPLLSPPPKDTPTKVASSTSQPPDELDGSKLLADISSLLAQADSFMQAAGNAEPTEGTATERELMSEVPLPTSPKGPAASLD